MRNLKIKLSLNSVSTAVILAILLSSCVSMSTMQTARVTEKGEVGYGFGGGMVNSEIPIGTLDTLSIGAPFLEASARYGLTDKLDVGAKLTIIGTSSVDAKYQFLGDNKSLIAGSIGLGAGYLSITNDETESVIVDLMVPAYFSIHPVDWLSLYCSPKYLYRINGYTSNGVTGFSNSHIYGATAGIRLGKKFAFLAEYSYFGNSQMALPLTQVTCGIAIGIK